MGSLQTYAEPCANRLSGKVALITGAAGSIGVATALRLLQEGCKLALVDIDRSNLTTATTSIRKALPKGRATESEILEIVANVTESEDMRMAVEEVMNRFGRLDCAFLNVGISGPATSLFDTTESTYDKIMQINVKSVFLGLKFAGAAMRDCQNGGSIIITSSIAGLRGTPGLIGYSTSKFALRGMCLTAAAELGQYGIRVNTIHPSGINTPMFQQTWSEEKMREIKQSIPLGRFAEVEDISGVVAFLASEDSRFINGAMIKIDGGCVSF